MTNWREQLQDIRWDEIDWSLVWKGAAIGGGIGCVIVVIIAMICWVFPRLTGPFQRMLLDAERDRRSRDRAARIGKGSSRGGPAALSRGTSSSSLSTRILRVLGGLLILAAFTHLVAPLVGLGGALRGVEEGADLAGVAGWAAQGKVFAQVTWRSSVGAASKYFVDWDVSGFESAAARIHAQGVADARAAGGSLNGGLLPPGGGGEGVPGKQLGAPGGEEAGTVWVVKGGLRIPTFLPRSTPAGQPPSPPAAGGAVAVATAAPAPKEEEVKLDGHPPNGGPVPEFAAAIRAEHAVGAPWNEGDPCAAISIGLAACSKNGKTYRCMAVPGTSVKLETDPAPNVHCLGGDASWGACNGGEFLCERNPPMKPTLLHTVFSVQPSKYFEWQVRYMAYHFNKSKQEGPLTRLLSGNHADHISPQVDTWVAPPYRHLHFDPYVPYNKPTAIIHWLRHSGVRSEYVIVVDPDCIFLRPLVTRAKDGDGVVVHLGSGRDVAVSKGKPFGQKGYMDWTKGGPFESLTKHYCPGCDKVDALAVPIVIHREDLEKIAPLWLSITEQIRADKATWNKEWNAATFALSWTAEMYGYIFAAAKLGIKHSVSDRAQEIVGFNKKVSAPILHYSLKLSMGKDKDGKDIHWHKYFENAGTVIPAAPAGQTEVVATLLSSLRDARDHLPPSTKHWSTSYFAAEA